MLAALSWTSAAAGKDAPEPRRLCFIVAGTRPEITFEKRGELYIEVDAPLDTIPPSQIEILEGKEEGESSDAVIASLPASLNEVVHFDGYKGGRTIRLALKRPGIARDASAGIDVTCDLGESITPLLVIFPENPSNGWENPAVRVLDVSPSGLPANAVLCINLSRANLGARIGTSSGAIASGQSKVFALPPDSAAPLPFKVDLLMSRNAIPLANSSYLKNPDTALILLAFPVPRVGPGNPPISLQFLPLPPMPARQPR